MTGRLPNSFLVKSGWGTPRQSWAPGLRWTSERACLAAVLCLTFEGNGDQKAETQEAQCDVHTGFPSGGRRAVIHEGGPGCLRQALRRSGHSGVQRTDTASLSGSFSWPPGAVAPLYRPLSSHPGGRLPAEEGQTVQPLHSDLRPPSREAGVTSGRHARSPAPAADLPLGTATPLLVLPRNDHHS